MTSIFFSPKDHGELGLLLNGLGGSATGHRAAHHDRGGSRNTELALEGLDEGLHVGEAQVLDVVDDLVLGHGHGNLLSSGISEFLGEMERTR
jgi:hypothetical protein